MEIRGPKPNNPINQPQGTPDAGKTDKAGKTNEAGFGDAMQGTGAAGGAGATGATGSAQQASQAGGPTFDRMSQQIRKGIDENKPKEEIMRDVVEDQLTAQFGDKVTPEMTNAVAEKFESDPNLSQLFNQLYAEATRR